MYQIHLVCHKLIMEMGVNSSNKAFRTIPHPSIYNVRSYVLHTGRCKGMTQVILCNFFILHHSLEYVDIFSNLFILKTSLMIKIIQRRVKHAKIILYVFLFPYAHATTIIYLLLKYICPFASNINSRQIQTEIYR